MKTVLELVFPVQYIEIERVKSTTPLSSPTKSW